MTTPSSPDRGAHQRQADRRAIRMLVDAGYVSQDIANEALSIAHGFTEGPLPLAAAQPKVCVVAA